MKTMGYTLKKGAIALLCVFFVGGITTSRAQMAVEAASTTAAVVGDTAVNTTHQATTLWGHVQNLGEWIEDRVEQLNQLTELIENNALTKAIRGFNELMTAIQTDISEVLGTVETLASTPMEIFDTLMEIPDTVFGMLGDLQGAAGGFMGIYDQAMGIFDMVGEAQAFGKGMGDALSSAGGGYGFMNQMGGMRTSLNSSWLKGGKQRDKKLKALGKKTYGKDAIQMQSSTNDILIETLRQNMRAADVAAVKELYEASKEIAAEEQLRARTGRTATQSKSWIHGQLRF